MACKSRHTGPPTHSHSILIDMFAHRVVQMRQGTNSESICDWSVSIYLIAQMPQVTYLRVLSTRRSVGMCRWAKSGGAGGRGHGRKRTKRTA